MLPSRRELNHPAAGISRLIAPTDYTQPGSGIYLLSAHVNPSPEKPLSRIRRAPRWKFPATAAETPSPHTLSYAHSPPSHVSLRTFRRLRYRIMYLEAAIYGDPTVPTRKLKAHGMEGLRDTVSGPPSYHMALHITYTSRINVHFSRTYASLRHRAVQVDVREPDISYVSPYANVLPACLQESCRSLS
ncbi:hypothetical protein PLICRDRAFT_58130 [Plicaturopsis crispa FD-325 SS-3]|uniref:Uncharacterized protein n=1 Tax=Plicaturopsis crispa FD-325 SS-3 TaxID=944288 RepID=A0A0C9T3T4_PLICR|nr:hypothetical protein PLICRDRAFT_58130 [Plicaturopsis crispa FD-325 SS-3]